MKPETQFRKRVDKDLDTIKGAFFESIQQRVIRGTADKIGCIRGRFIWLEFKKDEKTEPTELQKVKKQWVIDAGGIAFVVHPKNWKDVFHTLQRIAKWEGAENQEEIG